MLDSCEGVEFHAGMLAPAMVNAHAHLELSYLRGAITPHSGFAGFAAQMARVRGGFTAAEREAAAVQADAEMWEEGTDAVADISNDDSSFGVKSRSRIVYRTFAEVFGLKKPSFDAARPLLAHPRTSLTPHSTYSLDDRAFRTLCNEGEEPLSIHFMESDSERQLFEGYGPMAEWFAAEGFPCDFRHYGSPAKRIAACVPPGRSVLLVHCCAVTQEDIDVIMNHFTAPVYWVLCPRSNDYISGAKPDVGLLRRSGVTICTGTDSLASNGSLSLAEELRRLHEIAAEEDLTVAESYSWASGNGAAALGLTGHAIEPGSSCGIVCISGFDPRTLRPTPAFSVKRVL